MEEETLAQAIIKRTRVNTRSQLFHNLGSLHMRLPNCVGDKKSHFVEAACVAHGKVIWRIEKSFRKVNVDWININFFLLK